MFIAVDIGNSRIKFGLFDGPAGGTTLPLPRRTTTLSAVDWDAAQLAEWATGTAPETEWWLASVNRPATERLIDWIDRDWLKRPPTAEAAAPIRILTAADIPITAAVEHPDRVGIDRLAGAAAANRLRNPRRAAIVIGVGTAITVDLVSAQGVFCGGAIVPGIRMSTRALNQFTDLLPHIPLEELAEAPPPLGKSTEAAIRSGLYWGAVGAMRELIARLSEPLDAKPEIFLTGGAAPSVAGALDPNARYFEHLVLSGIAMAKIG
jgi:type III pantothenate kinase